MAAMRDFTSPLRLHKLFSHINTEIESLKELTVTVTLTVPLTLTPNILFKLRYLKRIPTRRRDDTVVLLHKNYVHMTRGCSLGGATSGQAGL